MEAIRRFPRPPRWFWRVVAGVLGLLVAALFVRHVWWPAKAGLESAHMRRLLEERRVVRAEVESFEDALERPGPAAERERLIARIEVDGGRLTRIAAELARRPGGDPESADELESALHGLLASLGADVEPLPRPLVRQLRAQLDIWRRHGVPRLVHERSRRLWPSVARAFAEENVPAALGWVAWSESGFETEVCSTAGARGLWQFMPATARHFGLKVDGVYDGCGAAEGTHRCDCGGGDERLDPLKASRAGARYLSGLLRAFGPGGALMALAAYHRGEEGLRRALRNLDVPESRRADFAYLVRMNHLPLETREYVPRVLAAMLVGTRPELFGVGATR
jgi:hypothetical protein